MSPLGPDGVRGRLAWPALFGGALLAVGAADGIVLAEVKAFFASGYNGRALRGAGDRVWFFLLGAACDAALLAPLWFGFSALLRRRIGPPRGDLLALGLAAATPLAVDVALHRLHRTLGDVVALDLLMDLAAGDERGAFEEVLASLPSVAVLAALVVGGGAALWFGSGWLARPLTPLRANASRRALAASLAVGVGLAALQWGQGDPVLRFGLGWKPSGMALRGLATRLTDLDFDGSGIVTLPRDAAPFDSSRHPFALEIRGNGIDENGLAGDLPQDFVGSPPLEAVRVAAPASPRRVIALVLLESFRADLVGYQYEGRAVLPNLDRLAAEGVSSSHAYTHTAMTWPARASLFQGRTLPHPDAQTLVDDFQAAGFEVAWFSGQHDGLREGPRFLGYERADHFFDARGAIDRRTSRSAQPVSLQVSWKTVLSEVESFLEERDPARPLFLYVNLVDTHFPYDHDQLDAIFRGERLPRDAIFRENRAAIWRAYLNAAAGVDRGLGRLRAALETHFPAGGISLLVTADHGEALYEPRFLGHGQALDRTQTGVPWVAYQLAGRWPEPLALSDARGALTRASHHPAKNGILVPDPARGLLLYSGNPEDPKLLGLRTLEGVTSWTPTLETAPAADDTAFARMIHTWESARLDRAAAEAELGP